MGFSDKIYIDGFREGYIISNLRDLIKNKDRTDLDEDTKDLVNKVFDKMYEDIPDDLIVKIKSLEDEMEDGKLSEEEKKIYEDYYDYFKDTNAFILATDAAIENLKQKEIKRKVNLIIDEIKEMEKTYKNKKGNIEICLKYYISDKSIGEKLSTTLNRMDEALLIKSEKDLKIIKDINDDNLTKDIINNFFDGFNIYRYKNNFLYIKDENTFGLYRIDKVNTAKPWMIKNIKGFEEIVYPRTDSFNRIT